MQLLSLQQLCLLLMLPLIHAQSDTANCDDGSLQTQDCEQVVRLPTWVWVIVGTIVGCCCCCGCIKLAMSRDPPEADHKQATRTVLETAVGLASADVTA